MRGALRLLGIALVALALPASASGQPARIAFDSGDDVALVNADGSGRTTLIHAPGRVAGAPAWSPDGTRLALTLTEDGNLRSRINIAGADGSGLQRITPRGSLATLEYAPEWSADGSHIAFVRYRFAQHGIRSSVVVVSADGSGARTVVEVRSRPFGGIDDVTWSPDGTRLVYSELERDVNDFVRPSMWSVAVDGTGRRRIARDAAYPSFSPDGRRMTYLRVTPERGRAMCEEDGGCELRSHLYVSDADGANERQLTSGPSTESGPVWSPDGARILFSSNRNYPTGDSSQELYTIAPDGRCLTWVTNGTPGSDLPAWEPGAGLSSDPGGCGAIARSPSVDVDLGPALGFKRMPTYWVGRIAPDGELLSSADRGHDGVDLAYGDCGGFDPKACTKQPFDVYSTPACRQIGPVYEVLDARLFMHRGALVVGDPKSLAVWTGKTVVYVSGRGAKDPILAQLRPLGSDTPPAQLPPAALPDKLWRQLNHLARSKRSRTAHRARAMRGKLRRFGVGHLRC